MLSQLEVATQALQKDLWHEAEQASRVKHATDELMKHCDALTQSLVETGSDYYASRISTLYSSSSTGYWAANSVEVWYCLISHRLKVTVV